MSKFVITDEDTGEIYTFYDRKEALKKYCEIRKHKPYHTLNLVRYTTYRNKTTETVVCSTI